MTLRVKVPIFVNISRWLFLGKGIINAWGKIKIILHGAPITHDFSSFFWYEFLQNTLTLQLKLAVINYLTYAHIRDTVLYYTW